MSLTKNERLASWLVAIIAFTLMQTHSIGYWVSVTTGDGSLSSLTKDLPFTLSLGTVKGITFSIALEAAALWLWYQRRIIARIFSIIASTLVITSALLHVSAPHFDKFHSADLNEELIASLRSEIADHQATLRQYEANSGKRAGWAPLIKQIRGDLETARSELRSELSKSSAIQLDFRNIIGIVLQALVLVVVMVAQILSVIGLRGSSQISDSDSGSSSAASYSDLRQFSGDVAVAGANRDRINFGYSELTDADRPEVPVSGEQMSKVREMINQGMKKDKKEQSDYTPVKVNIGTPSQDEKEAIRQAVQDSIAGAEVILTEEKTASSHPVEDAWIDTSKEVDVPAPTLSSSAPSHNFTISDYDLRVKAVADAIRKRLPLFQNKQTLLASKMDLEVKHITQILNHLSLKVSGKEVIGTAELKGVEQAFGIVYVNG